MRASGPFVYCRVFYATLGRKSRWMGSSVHKYRSPRMILQPAHLIISLMPMRLHGVIITCAWQINRQSYANMPARGQGPKVAGSPVQKSFCRPHITLAQQNFRQGYHHGTNIEFIGNADWNTGPKNHTGVSWKFRISGRARP